MEFGFEPLYDHIIVKPDKLEDTVGGLYVPEAYQDSWKVGTVMAVGNGYRSNSGDISPMTTKVGDRIKYDEYAGTKVYVRGEEYLFMRELAVIGIFRD